MRLTGRKRPLTILELRLFEAALLEYLEAENQSPTTQLGIKEPFTED